jgi:serine-type D-Ala-D-Ala carboxypeptidase/endopeptidase (penicillin-binding protein 4)
MRARSAALAAALLAVISAAWADTAADLKHSVASIISKAPDCEAGAEVSSLRDGDVLYARNAHKGFIPASNTKLITSATVLEMLGAGYRFHTTIYAAEETGISGVIDGDLVLKGDADPGLTTEYLAKAAAELRKAGIRRINGRVLATGPIGSGDVSVTAERTAEILYQRLGEAGVLVNGSFGAAKAVPEGALKLVGHESRPLQETVRLMNKPSDNAIADGLMRSLIIRVGAQRQKPLEFVTQFWQQRGLDTTGVRFYDGSGLSRGNRVTPAFLIGLLRYMRDDSANADAFRASLPIAGCDGTLARRMRETCAANNVRAKTGFLTGVCTLSGYVDTRDGEPLAFSFLFNNFDCDANCFRRLQDQLCVRLAQFGRKSSATPIPTDPR